jgi:lipopolysaccharide biosynthesis protein
MNKLAISLSLYYLDLWSNFLQILSPFKDHIHLYLCLYNDNGSQKHIIKNAEKNFDTTILFCDNYGADVAPFLNILELIKEPYFIKLHSKKSLLGQYNQIAWRHILLHDFFGDNDIFNNNYKTIHHSNCGAIGNKFLLSSNNELYHNQKILYLCDILNIQYSNIYQYSFFGGNMFMSKTELFKQHFLPYNHLLQKLLSQETKKVNESMLGTYSHSLERIFGYIIPYNHLNFYHPQLQYIKILNTKAPNNYFHMIKLYNNDCYLQEDLNVYGHILDESESNFTIEWHHMLPNPIQKYEFVDKATIIQKRVDTIRNDSIIHE